MRDYVFQIIPILHQLIQETQKDAREQERAEVTALI